MGEIVNLRMARKRKARGEREQAAAENRALHGRAKADRDRDAAEKARAEIAHALHRREAPSIAACRNTPTPDPSPQGGGGLEARTDPPTSGKVMVVRDRVESPSPLWGGVRGGGGIGHDASCDSLGETPDGDHS